MNEHLDFHKDEYEEIPRGVRVLLKTAIKKMPTVKRKHYSQLNAERQAVQKEQELIDAGIAEGFLVPWLNNFCSTATSGRAYSVIVQVLSELQAMLPDYGSAAINSALAKNLTQSADKCNIRYLKAIVKNEFQPVASAQTRPAPSALPSRNLKGKGSEWERMLRIIEHRFKDNQSSFNTWVKPCKALVCNQSELRVLCRDEIAADWLNTYYTGVFSQAFSQVFGRIPAHLTFAAPQAQGDK